MSWEIAIVFGIISIAFTLVYLGLNLKSEHSIVKLFFIMIGLFMMIVELALNETLVRANEITINNATITQSLVTQTNSIYQAGLYVGILSITYFFLYFVFNLISRFKNGGVK